MRSRILFVDIVLFLIVLPIMVAINAVDFDTTAHINRDADLTGNADGKNGTLSVWLKIEGSDDAELTIFGNEGNFYQFRRDTGNKFDLLGFDNPIAADIVVRAQSNKTYVTEDKWIHVLIAWNTAASAIDFYINDNNTINRSIAVNKTDDIVGYERTDWAIGSNQAGGSDWNGCISELWHSVDEYVNISIEANRRKFVTANVEAVNLGSDGSNPTGNSPILYFRGNAAGYLTNSGTGGDFGTTIGTLTNCGDQPPVEPDIIFPRLNASINNTSPSKNQVINVTANVTDEAGVDTCQFLMNGTADGSFIILNKSVTGTNDQCSQNWTIDLIKGNVINFTVLVNDTGNNKNQSEFLITTSNAVPATPTIILPTPDDYNNTQPNYPFNVTFPADPDGDAITIFYYINGKLNQTTTTNTTFNASDGYFILNVSLTDGFGFGPNATVNFTIDTTFPTTLNFNLTNNTVFGFKVNATFNITINDTNPFNLSFLLHNASIPELQFGFNDKPNSSTTISIVQTLNLSNLASGNYTLDINFSDRHTKADIDDYTNNKIAEGFNFKTAEGNDITIVQTFGKKGDRLESQKKIDRYTIEFGTTKNRGTRHFLITATSRIEIIKGTAFKGHLIIGNRNWMDFENKDKDSTVTIERLGDNMVLVIVFSNNFNFNSIGGLNTVNNFYDFQVDNDVPYYGAGTINNTLPNTGEVVSLSQLCGDIIALSTCILAHNQSGQFLNVTNTTLADKVTNEFNQTFNLTISGTDGATIGIQACGNDTFNQFSCSDISTLQINDDTAPIINGTTNVTLFYINQSINATFNMTDTSVLDTCQIIIDDNSLVRFFNFTLSGTKDTCSQNFTVSGPVRSIVNVTGRVNDTFGNLAQNQTLFSITKDFVITAINIYGNSTISAFNVTLSNSTTVLNITTENGTVTFPQVVDGTYNITIKSNESGGYHNRSFEGIDVSSDFRAELWQAIAYFTAKRRGTSVDVTDFNVSAPFMNNVSNSSGGARLYLNASNFLISTISTDYFNTVKVINLTNISTSNHIAQVYDINLTISVNSGINNTALKNFTIFLTGDGSIFSENLTADNLLNVTYSLGNNTYRITIDAPRHALFFATFFIGSNNTYPNLTFSLIGLNSVNFTIFDEITEQLITNNDSTISLISDAVFINNSATDQGTLYIQDLIPGDYRIEYDNPLYTKRDFYITVNNGTNQTVDLYLLSLGNGTAVTFTVQDNSGNKLNNATIRLKRFYGSTNSYRTVAMTRTNEEGDSEIDVDFNDAFYETLTTFKSFSLRTIGARIISITRILTIKLTVDPFETIDGINDLTTSLSFNNATQTFSYVFTQLSGISTTGTLEVIRVTPKSSVVVCTTSDTSSGATLLCQVNTTNTTGTYTAKGSVKVGNKNILTNTLNIFTGIVNKLRLVVGEQGFFFAILISGTLAGLGALVSPALAVLMFLVGIFISNFLGFSVIAASGVGLLIIIAMIMIWRMRR